MITPKENLDFLLEEAQQVFKDRSSIVKLIKDAAEVNKYYLIVEGVDPDKKSDIETELTDLVELHREVLQTEGVIPVVCAEDKVDIPTLMTPGTGIPAVEQPSKVVAIVSSSSQPSVPRSILAEEEIMKAVEELRQMALEA